MRPRENLEPIELRTRPSLPRWRSVRVVALAVAITASEWATVVVAHALGLT